MARVDSILSVIVKQGADELRMGTDLEPQMLAAGQPRKLALAATPDDALRALLGDILSPERDADLRRGARVDLLHDAGAAGPFRATLSARPGNAGIDVVFLKGAVASAPAPSTPPTRSPASSTPVTRLAALVSRALAHGASDLHLADDEPAYIRVDGVLQRLHDDAHVDVREAIPLDPASLERVQGGESVDLAIDVEGAGRIRANVYRTAGGLVAAVRLMPAGAPSLASLHMPVALDDLVDLPHGLVLVCGATGSGKSTTLAALAQEALRKRSILLITLEDPIEYTLTAPPKSLVRRRQVGRDARDFAGGLRDALREDPDVLVVGEMRDPETIGLALTAAETGHLVLASLHSRSAASAIERIVDAYAPERQRQVRVQLADSLRAVIAQRLLPRASGSGRIPAVELLRVTHAVASVIRDGKTAQIPTLLQSGRREGMLALEHCLAERVQSGAVLEADAQAAANDPGSLAMYMTR